MNKKFTLFSLVAIALFSTTFVKANVPANLPIAEIRYNALGGKMYKIEYTYNGEGQKLSEIDYSPTSKGWNVTSKNEWQYNTNGDIVEHIAYGEDIWTSEIVGEKKETYTYNTDNKKTSYTIFSMYSKNWVESKKYEYDEKERIIKEYSYEDNGELSQTYKYEYSTDDDNNIIETKYYLQSADNWEEWSKNKIVNTYDDDNNLISVEKFLWNSYSEKWRNSEKVEYTYDDNNNQTSEATYSWDVSAEKWYSNSSKSLYSFDGNGNILSEEIYEWKKSDSKWIEKRKYSYEYDVDGRELRSYVYSFNNETNDWSELSKNENTYNVGGLLIKSETYALNNSEYKLEAYSVYQYATTETSIREAIAIDTDNKVYDLNGRLVETEINALPRGVYIVGGKKILKH